MYKMAKNILLVGCGNIGFRHLQSLENISDLNIDIVDKYKNEILNIEPYKKYNFFYDINNLTRNKYDLIIIATCADIRKEVALKIIDKFNEIGTLVLEKVVFQKLDDFDEVYIKFYDKFKHINIYCNCMWQLYKEHFTELNDLRGKIYLSGSDWGFCCNACHIFSLYYNVIKNFNTNFENYEDDLLIEESKRVNFKEITGTINYDNCQFKSLKESNIPISILFETNNGDNYRFFFEGDSINKYKNNELVNSFAALRLSRDMTNIYNEILNGKEPNLPNLLITKKIHSFLFQALEKVFNTDAFSIT